MTIESDKILVSHLLEFNNTFAVKLQKAAMLKMDKDVTMLFGQSRNNFQRIYLRPGVSKKVEFKRGKFRDCHLYTRTIGGENVYQVAK